MLGEGAFNIVSLHSERVSAKLRAVKAIAKDRLKKPGMEYVAHADLGQYISTQPVQRTEAEEIARPASQTGDMPSRYQVTGISRATIVN